MAAAAAMMAVVEPLSGRADRSMQLLTPSDRDGVLRIVMRAKIVVTYGEYSYLTDAWCTKASHQLD